jgi:Ca-activated chloride channel family protein
MRTTVIAAVLFFAPVLPRFAAAGDGGPKLLDGVTPRQSASRSSIRVDVNMTLVPVTVVDRLGRNVLGLDRDNFQLYDGKEQRPIVSFSQQDAPVSVGVVFDSSGSMSTKLSDARAALAELFRHLNPEDEALLVGVAERAELKAGMTSDLAGVADTVLFTKAGGRTPLLDGVYLALEKIRHARNPRKALIVISDGGDNNSRYTMQELLTLAQEADTQIYSIVLVHNPDTPEEAGGPELLGKLAAQTGGRAFESRNFANVRDAMARIGITLHNQYVIGYYPPDDAPAGKYRKIRVELRLPAGVPRLQVYARQGYYAPDR